jgi:hypothetical protein
VRLFDDETGTILQVTREGGKIFYRVKRVFKNNVYTPYYRQNAIKELIIPSDISVPNSTESATGTFDTEMTSPEYKKLMPQ